MALVTTEPKDLPTTDALADIPDDLLQVPAAYLSFGSTPYALPEPPEVGEKRTYTVRVECTGEAKSVRTDGELRYNRKLSTLWAVVQGQPEPPDPDQEQPGLFDGDEGEPTDEATGGGDE